MLEKNLLKIFAGIHGHIANFSSLKFGIIINERNHGLLAAMNQRGVQANTSRARAKDGHFVILGITPLSQQPPARAKSRAANSKRGQNKINNGNSSRKICDSGCIKRNNQECDCQQRHARHHTHGKDGANVARDFFI